ncbi:hypothetical protein F511_37191 [Dorcoceras hygrometricum]|uniref:Dystroglycan-like n=1 Tax=Dorcoceras hygrometricum TaxID=472368 RepID=A0A2Z7D087_9LAMI|nr:hypothetical protein F511_37191 [Dorcoceras hygrometricum]
MASSLINSSHHIDFDSVFGMEDASLAPMFESLITTGLKEFLGCPAIFYEAALTEFFANGSVRDGVVVSTIGGTAVEISESVFAATFELPSEGLTDLSEVPKNMVFDARSLFSDSKEQVSISCFKKELKIEYRLLHDILAKTIYVKAGSFDAVTCDRFMLMTAITFDVKINWSNLLFGVLKAMVTPGSRQAKGFAIQIGVVLSNIPGLKLGEPCAFPAPRVLNEKTVHRLVHINEQVGMEKTAGSPPMKKTPKKRAVSKKRPVDSDAEISEDMMLPSVTAAEITKIRLGESINIPGVQERDLFYASLPRISIHDKGKEPLVEDELAKGNPARESVELIFGDVDFLVQLQDQASISQSVDTAHHDILSRLRTVEHSLQTSLGHQNDYLRSLIQSARQEGQIQDDVQILRLNELKKAVIAQGVSADTESLAIRNKFNVLDAKFLLLDGQVTAIRSDQLEFQAKIAADLLSLSTQIGDLVDYIRGGDAKKGEGSSSRPQPTPDVQGRGGGDTGGGSGGVRTTTIVDRLSLEEVAERIREADRQRSNVDLERERNRERRERRLSRSGPSKRRRY